MSVYIWVFAIFAIASLFQGYSLMAIIFLTLTVVAVMMQSLLDEIKHTAKEQEVKFHQLTKSIMTDTQGEKK